MDHEDTSMTIPRVIHAGCQDCGADLEYVDGTECWPDGWSMGQQRIDGKLYRGAWFLRQCPNGHYNECRAIAEIDPETNTDKTFTETIHEIELEDKEITQMVTTFAVMLARLEARQSKLN